MQNETSLFSHHVQYGELTDLYVLGHMLMICISDYRVKHITDPQ